MLVSTIFQSSVFPSSIEISGESASTDSPRASCFRPLVSGISGMLTSSTAPQACKTLH